MEVMSDEFQNPIGQYFIIFLLYAVLSIIFLRTDWTEIKLSISSQQKSSFFNFF